MPSRRKTEIYLWDDESGEPAPFTPEDVDARLEAANDRAEQEDLDEEARFKEIDALLTRQEALAASLYAVLQESIKEMNGINARVAALSPRRGKIERPKRRRTIAPTQTSPVP